MLPVSSVFSQFTVQPTKHGNGPPPSKPKLVPPPAAGLLPLPQPPLPVNTLQLPVAAAFEAPPPVATAARSRRCAGAGRRPRRSARGRKATRKAVLCLLNLQRRAHGLPGLRSNRRLLRAAEAHSRSMVRLGYFSHDEPGGIGVLSRILRSGYLSRTHGWSVGENLGMGQGPGATPRAMVRAWMGSTPHRANILAGKFREIGLGVISGVPGRPRASGATFTTDFGRRH